MELETTIPTIDTIDTPTVKTTEKIYTDEVAKKVDISGGSDTIKLSRKLDRKESNTGGFEQLEIPMQKGVTYS